MSSLPAASPPTDLQERHKAAQALARAVPVTRMVDYGVPLGAALDVHQALTAQDAPRWEAVCAARAEPLAQLADRAQAEGRVDTAAWAWRATAALLQCAQLAFNADTPCKADLYRQAHAALLRHASLAGDLEALQLDTPAGALHGWLCRPARATQAAVVLVGGLSGWGSVYLDMARALARRGILAVLAEGPGQGLTRLQSGLRMGPHTLPLLARFVDLASLRGATRIGVWGNSFGGLFAAQLAARDARVRAACINGAPMAPQVPGFRTAREQMEAAFGTSGDDALAGVLQALSLDPARQRIQGPVLVLEGGCDPLVPPGSQDAFLGLSTRPQHSAVWRWPDGEHTLYNHAQERDARVADWFAAVLG